MQLIGILTTAAVEVVGYYYEYSNKAKFGLCLYTDHYPGIRRACTLDWVAGAMGIALGVLIIIAECAATYINQKDVGACVSVTFPTLYMNYVFTCSGISYSTSLNCVLLVLSFAYHWLEAFRA